LDSAVALIAFSAILMDRAGTVDSRDSSPVDSRANSRAGKRDSYPGPIYLELSRTMQPLWEEHCFAELVRIRKSRMCSPMYLQYRREGRSGGAEEGRGTMRSKTNEKAIGPNQGRAGAAC
jgi:hypothetical protein